LAGLVSAGAIAVLAGGCGAAKTSANQPPTGFGQFAVRMVDAPPDKSSDVAEIWVSITEVTAHASPGGWTTIVAKDPPLPVNLLALQDSALDLGFANLPVGTVTQIRLYVSAEEGANYIVRLSDLTKKHVPLKVPSGVQSGIKIKGPWDIVECNQTAVTIDFDGKKSIWYHPTGQDDEWILRPVIHVKKGDVFEVGCVPDDGTGGVIVPPECQATSDCAEREVCADGICTAGDTNAPCALDSDCASLICRDDLSCAPMPTAVPEGGGCVVDGDCLSGSCIELVCGPSLQGHECGEAQSCGTGLTCTAGFCYGGEGHE
jgi:hypothetical protein